MARCQLGKVPVLALVDGTGRTLWALDPDDLEAVAAGRNLFTVTKRSARHAAIKLFDATAELAAREGKCPVVALCQKSRPGYVLVIDPADVGRVAAAWSRAKAERERRAGLDDGA